MFFTKLRYQNVMLNLEKVTKIELVGHSLYFDDECGGTLAKEQFKGDDEAEEAFCEYVKILCEYE